MTESEKEQLNKMDLQHASTLVKKVFAQKKASLEKVLGDKLPQILANLRQQKNVNGQV